MWPLAECISSILVQTPSLQLGVLQSLHGSFLLCPILLSHLALSYPWWKPGQRRTSLSLSTTWLKLGIREWTPLQQQQLRWWPVNYREDSCHDRGHVFLFLHSFSIICFTPPVLHPYVTSLSLLSLLFNMPDGYTLLGMKAVTWPYTASWFTWLCYLRLMLCNWLHPAPTAYNSCCALLYYISRTSCSGTL